LSEESDTIYPEVDFFIRRIIDLAISDWKSIRFTHPIRGDLEVMHYSRQSIESFASSSFPCRSLPLILFVDEFGVYRNMYRALKGFYISPANVEFQERRKPGNQFTLTLRPYGAVIEDIMRNLELAISKLGKGWIVEIEGNETLVKAFPIVITRDMPASADHSGFYRHNANLGCRACKVPLA
jgi:hypothetical protein